MSDRPGISDEELLPRGPGRPRVWVAGLVVLAAVAIVAGAVVRFTHGSADRHEAGPAVPTASAPDPVRSPALPAVDVLVLDDGYGWNVDGHRVEYTVDLQNISDQVLRISGPVQLWGPDGAAVPHANASVVARDRADPDADPAPLDRIAPKQHVSLLIRVQVDCTRDRAETRWPERYPTVFIRLDGFDRRPWTMGFGDLVDGRFLHAACH